MVYKDKEGPTLSALAANFFFSLSDNASMGFVWAGKLSSAETSANLTGFNAGAAAVGGRAVDSE